MDGADRFELTSAEWAAYTHSLIGLCAAYAPVPHTGALTRLYCAQNASTSGGSANALTVAVNGTTVSGIAERIANATDAITGTYTAVTPFAPTTTSGSAGVVTRFTPSGSGRPDGYPVSEGDTISVTSDGAGTDGTLPCTFSAIIKRI